MTVPVQRGGNQDDPTITNLILAAIDDLKNGFVRLEERISARVEGLTEQFVPRTEYESRHSDVRNEITKTDARVEAVAARVDSRIDAEVKERKALEEKLIAQRRFALTTSLLGLAAVISLLTLIFANVAR